MRAVVLLVSVACSTPDEGPPAGGDSRPDTEPLDSTSVVEPAGTSDVFQHTPGAIDLLFVIDDSCGMSDDQQRLVWSSTSLLSTLAAYGLDAHLGVVTTDMNDPNKQGKLRPDRAGRRYIDAATPSPATSFSDMAMAGDYGSGSERGLDAVFASLNLQPATNTGFRRSGAQYAVVVLSDEQDVSQITEATCSSTVLAEESHRDDATFTSIVSRLGGSSGTRYAEVTSTVGGELEDISVPDYAPVIDDLAHTWWTSEPYGLSIVPQSPSALVVTVDGQPVAATDFVYDPSENSVRFTNGFAPLAGATVEITR